MKKLGIMVILILSIMLLGCTQGDLSGDLTLVDAQADETVEPTETNMPEELNMAVENGNKIKVLYKGSLEDGTVFDSSEKHGNVPLEFAVGAGQMIKGFDKAVVGMKKDEEKTVTLAPADAYGEWNEQMLQELDLNTLTSQGIEPAVGMMLSAGGRPVKVHKIEGDKIWVDFNHELAGKTLVFWIKIVEIQTE